MSDGNRVAGQCFSNLIPTRGQESNIENFATQNAFSYDACLVIADGDFIAGR
jgi:hypothetical protein